MQPPSEALINSNIADGMPILEKTVMNERFHEHYGAIVTVERNPGPIRLTGKGKVHVFFQLGFPAKHAPKPFSRHEENRAQRFTDMIFAGLDIGDRK